MREGLISVIDLANRIEKRKQTVFKVLARLSIEPRKLPGSNNRGQLIAYVTEEEARAVETELSSIGTPLEDSSERNLSSSSDALLAEQGVFYLLLLEPEHDPGRFKLGFAASLPERLRQLRCSAPLIEVVRTWPCKRLWEKTAIECAANGCTRLHTEVFRTESIASVISRCEQFFNLMPNISHSSEAA